MGDKGSEELILEIKFAEDKCDEIDEPQKTILKTILNSLKFIISDPTIIKESKVYSKDNITLIKFLKEHNIKNHSDRVICMAYFLCKFRNVDPFNKKNIQEMYSEARIKEPKNLSDIITKQTKKDYLLEKGKIEGLKSFCITTDGIEHMKNLKKQL